MAVKRKLSKVETRLLLARARQARELRAQIPPPTLKEKFLDGWKRYIASLGARLKSLFSRKKKAA